MNRLFRTLCFMALCALAWPMHAAAQGVTTGNLQGRVINAQGQPVAGASVVAIHTPSGTTYEATSRDDGRFSIPGMRVGGPYSVTVAHAGTGPAFEPQSRDDVTINLGLATELEFKVTAITVTEAVTVSGQADPVFSSDRTGAATQVTRLELDKLPTISNRFDSYVRLSPQSGGGMTFGGVDNRLNNVTIDGAAFNNSFGLAGTPGERTGVAPISMNAVEQIQINIAPYDVRQGNFVGAAVNSVTRSGSNQFRGMAFHEFRNQDLVGTEAAGEEFDPGLFDFRNSGGWFSGPVVRNKLFFFGNFEDELREGPATTFRANRGGEEVGGNVTRVLASDLDQLSSFLSQNFDYETGIYEGYPEQVPGRRFLVRTDYNLNNENKLNFRYLHLDSNTDQLVSNSSSLGFGSRRTNRNALNFQNSNYRILENIRSAAGEWNTVIGDSMANQLIGTFSYHDESRESVGTFFPMVDILEGNSVYTTFGFEPFTPNNELRYHQFILTNNLTKFFDRHSIVAGVNFQRYESENVFFPGSQSVYVYRSLEDFYTDANDFLANPNRTTSPVNLRRFQLRWMNIPGLEKPVQPLEVNYMGGWIGDDWRFRDNVTFQLGLRVDVPVFGDTAFANADADALEFRDETGATVRYSTGELPDARPLWSPRFGFNWALDAERNTQIRGGSGIFTGSPAFVWISNQIGNTGVLTGFERLENTTARPFHPDPNHYKPTDVSGDPASSYELALTDADFKFPQVWRTNIAVDQRLPWGFTGSIDLLYNRDINGIYYINANLPAPQTETTGADVRPRWTQNRIHSHIDNAIVMKNQNEGRSWHAAFSLTRRFDAGLFLKTAYSFGRAKNTIDPGSIAFGSWNNNPHPGDPNNPGLGYSGASAGHRFFLAATYSREYFDVGATSISAFWESRTGGQSTYVFSGDVNGDGGTSNDLIYVHRDTSEMNFVQNGAFSPAEQAAAWDAFISSDPYLSSRRGQYAERGGVFLPLEHRLDLSVTQDIFRSLGGARHGLQFRIDIVNFTNLLNSDWGVGQRLTDTRPLRAAGVDSQGRLQYRMTTDGDQLLTRALETTAGLGDVWQIRFGFRYRFN